MDDVEGGDGEGPMGREGRRADVYVSPEFKVDTQHLTACTDVCCSLFHRIYPRG